MMTRRGWLQSVVRNLMQTILEDHPTLLSHAEKSSLMDAEYCKDILGLKLPFPLLGNARVVNGQARYWSTRYDGYYVCSEWWKDYHRHNVRMLRKFIDDPVSRRPHHPGIPALKRHWEALEEQGGTSETMSDHHVWRTYAAAPITDLAANITQDSPNEIALLCDIAPEIADEMVERVRVAG